MRWRLRFGAVQPEFRHRSSRRATRLLVLLQLAILPMCVSALRAQVPDPVPPPGDSVLVTPGAHYDAGKLWRTFMGGGHRDLWTTAIWVPVADLATLGGGLTPDRVGGGTTTRTLHLYGIDGRHYVFRSVDKDPIDLVGEFGDTPLAAILRDQMSSFHPSGAVVVARLLDAVDVLHVTPRLMVVPDDPALEEFRAEFKGMLVLFEERPDDPPEGQTTGFAGSLEIVSTATLFDLLEEDPRHHIETNELLRARLVDLIVGDRDRSTNNHLWARFDDGSGGNLWRPVPRDRDQAFVQLNGFLKALARRYEPRLVPWGTEYPSVEGLTRDAWDIDRNFLVGVSRSEWLETVQAVKSLLTDRVIDEAVGELPVEHFAIDGADMAQALRARRDDLEAAAEQLYDIVFGYADVHATDMDDESTIERFEDGSVRVRISSDGSTTFDRTFSPSETAEVRLYLHGGADQATIQGTGPGRITLRVIGGGGPDRLVDVSSTERGANIFYDGGGATEVTLGPGTRFHRRNAPRPFSWHEESRTLDWGGSRDFQPRFSYDADRGLVLTAGVTLDRYGFLKDTYASRVRMRAGWSFGLQEPVLDYRHYLRDALGGSDVRFHSRWSGAELIDFYGLGNETPVEKSNSFHRVAHKQLLVSAVVSLGDGGRRQLSLGPVFEYTTTDTTNTASFVSDSRPYGSGGFAQLGLGASFELDGRDRAGTPSGGYLLDGGATYVPAVLDVDRGAFGEVHGQAAAYLSPGGGNPTLALRASGKKLWGTYPFAEAAFLGGSSSVRGLREQRYGGDASLLGSAELRIFVARLSFIVPSDFGVFGLVDGGRVYRGGESSDTWHTAYGGGIWLAPLRRTSVLQVSVARASSGRTAVYFGIDFAF